MNWVSGSMQWGQWGEQGRWAAEQGHWAAGQGWCPMSLLFGILIPALLIGGAIFWFNLIRNRFFTPAYTSGRAATQPSPLDILRQRYARGEIDAVTFEQMRERLEGSGGPKTD